MLVVSGPTKVPLGLCSLRNTGSCPHCKEPDPKGSERKQTAKCFQKAAWDLDFAVAITSFSFAKPSSSFLTSHYSPTWNGRLGCEVLQPIALIRLQEKYIKKNPTLCMHPNKIFMNLTSLKWEEFTFNITHQQWQPVPHTLQDRGRPPASMVGSQELQTAASAPPWHGIIFEVGSYGFRS